MQGTPGGAGECYSVSFLWVPGYSGVIGNEKADRLLANRGATAVRVTRCSIGLPACYLDELLEKWLGNMAPKRMAGREGFEIRQKVVGSPYLEAGQLKELDQQLDKQEVGIMEGKRVGTMGLKPERLGRLSSSGSREYHPNQK